MKKSQSGFTLIELVVVIVLLGILGVTALGKFQDLSGDAQNAANQGVASELTAASTLNFAAKSLSASNGVSILTGDTCEAVATDLMAIKPAGYTFTNTGAACASAGNTRSCEVVSSTAPTGDVATASIICVD